MPGARLLGDTLLDTPGTYQSPTMKIKEIKDIARQVKLSLAMRFAQLLEDCTDRFALRRCTGLEESWTQICSRL